METMTYTGHLVITSCWCGITLAIPDDLYSQAHRRKTNVYCPLGHSFIYDNTVAEQNERLKRQVDATRDLLRAEERSHIATRGHLTRRRKQLDRVTRGVCPCCNRHFANVEKHMATQHPTFDPVHTDATL